MSEWTEAYEDDYSTLGFDIDKHKEAFNAFFNLNLDERSIKAALRAREMVVNQFPTAHFGIGITSTSNAEQSIDSVPNCIASVTINQGANSDEALRIQSDVARYFLRHFPGRYLKAYEPLTMAQGQDVYIVFFHPEVAV